MFPLQTLNDGTNLMALSRMAKEYSFFHPDANIFCGAAIRIPCILVKEWVGNLQSGILFLWGREAVCREHRQIHTMFPLSF